MGAFVRRNVCIDPIQPHRKGGGYMAMLQLGKLKFNVNDGGVDFRWGDGEVKRLGRKSSNDSEEYIDQEYDDQYSEFADFDEEADMNYGGRFADDQGYAEDDYDDYPDDGYDDRYDDGYDDGYADDGYNDGYADDDYADDGYDDRYADDYDDGYMDEGYDDGYGDYQDYDDRYSDEDADDGYAPYDDGYDEGYDEGYDDGYAEGGLMQYVDDNDWVTYLLLVLLPPLGIYLLWRRQRFEPVIRYSVMAASAVWFVVMIILLITLVFSGHNEYTNDPQLPTLKPTAVATAAPSPSPSPTAVPNNALNNGIAPSATPIGGGAAATLPDGSVVWASASGNFYHNNQACTLASGETLAQTTIENAKNRNKYACPTCYGGQLYYATAGGDHYHLDSTCSDMSNAEMYTKEKAEAEKKTACPVCVTKTQQTLVKVPDSLTFITANTKDKSGIKVWCTSGGVNYHMTSSCRGMSGAKQVSLSEALLMGKTACKTCCEVSGETVYCTKGGTYYHRNSTCSGMKGASKVTIAEALVLGKKECRTCRPVANSNSGNTSDSKGNSSETSKKEETAEEYYVYATKNGEFYHVKKNCSGMNGASKVTLKAMIAEGRPACPECCGGAGMSVYATRGGTYYHSYATCSGMSNAKAGSLSDALADGYKRCPRCWGETDSTVNSGSSSAGSSASTATSDTVKVYATTNGKWYHTKKNCTGMKNARHITLTQAMDEGKTACPTCATTAVKIVYSNSKGKYYHKAETCDNMKGAAKRTLAEALKLGQTACPVCMTNAPEGSGSQEGAEGGENSDMPEKVADFKVGTSGVKVYASMTQKYYHTKKSCTSAELTHVALETALNYGRKACPKCASTASETVYATKNGKYYHVTKSCAGSGATKGALDHALAYGFSPCPYCVEGKFDEDGGSGDYESGRSGIKVYATTKGSYYHADKSCAGNGAAKITLETALNYGKKACQDCCAIADRKVYVSDDSFHYHANRDCAGSDVTKSTYAKALADGLDACPNCIGGSGSSGNAPDAGPEYSAPAESSVYVDLYAEQFYYHKSSKCSDSGMKNGTEVTLEYAKDFGYERCPYCKPAASVE